MKSNWLSLFKLNKFDFGGRIVHQFVLFECKFLFSLHIFYFTKSGLRQDRFHTHAFNALSIKLYGSYLEYVLLDEKTGEREIVERDNIFKWFPRDSYHSIGESKKGCVTLLISGPWKKYWKEWIDGEVKWYTWNRKEEKEIIKSI